MLIGEGEIEGPPTGDILRSLFFDDTVVKSAGGEINFKNYKVDYRNGTQNQSLIPGLSPGVISETSLNVSLKQTVGSITQTISNPDATHARVRVYLPRLTSQDDKGNVKGSKVSFKIELSSEGGRTSRSMAAPLRLAARPRLGISGRINSSCQGLPLDRKTDARLTR